MNTPTIPFTQKRRLQAYFALSGMPVRKNGARHKMFDSRALVDSSSWLTNYRTEMDLPAPVGPVTSDRPRSSVQ